MSNEQEKTLDQLTAELKNECERLSELEGTARIADNNVTTCKRAINGFQKMIDELIGKLKEDVPYESRWALEREGLRK